MQTGSVRVLKLVETRLKELDFSGLSRASKEQLRLAIEPAFLVLDGCEQSLRNVVYEEKLDQAMAVFEIIGDEGASTNQASLFLLRRKLMGLLLASRITATRGQVQGQARECQRILSDLKRKLDVLIREHD